MMKTLLILLLSASPYFLFAQKQGQKLIDSLLIEFRGGNNDTTSIIILTQVSREYAKIDLPDKGIEYGQNAMNISNKINWEKGIALSLQSIGACYGVKKKYDKAMELLQKSLKIFERLNEILLQVKVLEDLSVFSTQDHKDIDAIAYRLQAKELCEKKGDIKRASNIVENIGLNYANITNYNQALKYWLQSWEMKETIGDTIQYGRILNNIGLLYSTYIYPVQRDVALTFHVRALKLSKVASDTGLEVETVIYLEVLHTLMTNYTQALNYGQQALKLKKEIGDENGVAAAMIHLMDIYSEVGDYPKAIDLGLQALGIAEKANDNALLATCLNDLSPIYVAMGNHTKALDCLQKALKIWEEAGDDRISETLGNIGAIYCQVGDYPKALKYLQEAIKFDQEHGFRETMATKFDDLSLLYYKKGQFAMALKYAYDALQISTDFKNSRNMSKGMESIGKIYLRMAQDSSHNPMPDSLYYLSNITLLRRSVFYLKKAIDLAKEISNADYLQHEYLLLSEAYTLQNKTGDAFESYKLYIIYRDSAFSIEKNKEFIRKDLQFEKEKEISRIKAENDKQLAVATEVHNSKIRLLVIGGAGSLFVFFLGFSFYRKRENDKYRLRLSEAKREAINAQMSDHFISNVMDSINSFIETNEKDKASKYLLMFHRLIRKVLTNSSRKLISLKDELDVLNIYIELEKLRFLNGTIKYSVDIHDDIDIENAQIPPLVLQILVENSLKHGFRKDIGGEIRISINKLGNNITCTVEDNGIGRKASSLHKSTENNNHESYGSSLVEKLIVGTNSKNKKSIVITDLVKENNVSVGTSVFFTLPYITN